MRLISFIFLGLMCSYNALAQLYYPNETFYNSELERSFLHEGKNNSHHFSHNSLKPLQETHTIDDSIYYDGSKQYYWLTQKLFKENFLIFSDNKKDPKKANYWCSVDPILDLEGGSDLAGDSLSLMYWNTRGIRVQARFLDKVAFTTSVYETQSIQPEYFSDYVSAHGEFYPNTSGGYYTQQNGVVPGYARTKPFKINGFDYSMAQGQLAINPNQNLNITIGNGNHFIGNGYRSLLLSDFTTPYPFINARTYFWEGRIQYSIFYSIHQNLYRLSQFTTPEATYEKNLGAHQYLDISITKNWQLGIFHGSLWNRVDSSGLQKLDPLYFNPIIGVNNFIQADQDGRNHISGINSSFSFLNTVLYGQLVLGRDFNLGGYQIGFKTYDLIIPYLDFRAEYNHVNANNYLSDNERMNWSSNNLPLAHPLTAGFDELIARVSYQRKRFFVQNVFTYSARNRNDNANIGTHILSAASTDLDAAGFYQNHVVLNQLEIGYRFNRTNNLQLFIGHTYRNETVYTNKPTTNYVYAGIRTRLNNKILNF